MSKISRVDVSRSRRSAWRGVAAVALVFGAAGAWSEAAWAEAPDSAAPADSAAAVEPPATSEAPAAPEPTVASEATEDAAATAAAALAEAEARREAEAAYFRLPDRDAEEAAELEAAFEDLRSEDEGVWRPAQEKVVEFWSRSGSASADLLLKRGRDAMAEDEFEAAMRHFDDLVNLAPDFAEGWSARATAHYRLGDLGAALADIAETIALEPRHFAALTGLGVILDSLDHEAEALAAFRAALEINPNLEEPKEAVKRLALIVEGRPI